MEITLSRYHSGHDATIGMLSIDGLYECMTLEDVVRETKIFGMTAIPAGRYRVIVNFSPRFQKMMPRLLNVPGFDGILIHKGNKPEDTHGCILVGNEVVNDRIAPGTSTPAYDKLLKEINERIENEEVWITITNDFKG